ncbi:MAG TPA: cardiolipin synthase ClsB [Burkholderiales bacterium]|nr:cardiolipin synthase ClsB [Burkholderiales bacterium]
MTEFEEGNQLILLENGREYFPALEAACDAAVREIHVETYIYADDAAGERIGAALVRAARRGVAAHLLVDGYGSKRLGDAFLERLRQGGVKVLVYRPDIAPWRTPRQRLRRMHRKLAVIDARIAFVGGINVIDDMHTPGHTPPRFDYAVRLEGPLLGEVHTAVKRLWSVVQLTQLGGGWPNFETQAPHIAACGRERAAFLVRDNLWHRDDIEEAYLSAIGQARSEVLIANSYFFPGLAFRHALVEATARGVRVVLLLQGRVEYRLLHYASRALYGSLLDAGVEIHEYHKSFLHAKVAVIDGEWATVGSSNIDPFSLLLAREANLVVSDRAFATRLRGSLQNAMRIGARQVVAEAWHRRPLPERIAHWTCYGFARLLTGVSAYGQAREFA